MGVDEEEGAVGPGDRVVGQRHRRGQTQPHQADVVELQGVRRHRGQVVQVEAALNGAHDRLDRLGAVLEQHPRPGAQGILAQPGHAGGDLGEHLGRVARRGQGVAAGHVDVVGQTNRHRLTLDGLLQAAFTQIDAGHVRAPARRQDHHGVADAHRARGDLSGIAPVVAQLGRRRRTLGTDDQLDREAESTLIAGGGQGLQKPQQGRPLVEGRAGRGLDDVVAQERGGRQDMDLGHAQLRGHGADIGLDGRVDLGGEVHQVDLVDRDDDVRDPQEGGDRQVAARLLQDPVAGVHQQHDDVGRGAAGDRVAGVLHVPGAVGQDEGALRGGEVAVGDVDRDALLPLGPQTVGQQGEVGAGQAPIQADLLDGGQLVAQHGLGVEQQAAHERGLAVVDAAGRGQPQQ